MKRLVIYCADIGSVPNGRFGWARSEAGDDEIERHRGGTEIVDLVAAVADDLIAGHRVALGFECPLFVPVPDDPLRLGAARLGEANRPWSAGAGSGALATGLVQTAWMLAELRRRAPDASASLEWSAFAGEQANLFLWEAFVTGTAKTPTHIDDATAAVAAFRDALLDVEAANAVTASRPLSLLGAALVWSGWSDDCNLLSAPCLVIRAAPEPAARPPEDGEAEPPELPRANRDAQELARKVALLDEPHIAPLTAFVRRLRAERGTDSVPWFDPTEAGVDARILMLFENPGRRADATQGSGFISADNDDKTAENMWTFLRAAKVERRRDVVAWNIVPWYLGDDRRIGKVVSSDIDDARPSLLELLTLLSSLRAVVLFGRKAQAGWRRARPPVTVPVLEAPHPSGRWLNGHSEDRVVIIEALHEALRIARD